MIGNTPDYRCSVCKELKEKNTLLTQRIQFVELGAGGRTIKSRVLGKICRTCVLNNSYWLQAGGSTSRNESVNAIIG